MSTSEIDKDNARIQYKTDGINNIFSFYFPIFSKNDIEIYLDDKLQSQNFIINKSKVRDGGEVIFDTPPPANILITIYRKLAARRTTDFSESQAFKAKSLNYEFNYITSYLKQLSQEIKRCLSLNVYEDINILNKLPSPCHGKALIWSEDEKGLKNSVINIEELDQYIEAAQKLENSAEEAIRAAEKSITNAEKVELALNEVQDSLDIINNLSNKLSKKASINLDNITLNGSTNIQGVITPDYDAGIDISYIENDITYITPSAGIVTTIVNVNSPSSILEVTVNGNPAGRFVNDSNYAANKSSVVVPVGLNDIVTLKFTCTIKSKTSIFYPYKKTPHEIELNENKEIVNA